MSICSDPYAPPGTTFYVDVQTPNEFDAISQLEKDWKAAIAAAREDCGKAGTCCKKIAVSIICSEDPNPTDKSGEPGMRRHLQEVSKQFKKMNKKYQRPTDWCGKKTIISCKDFKREK